MFTLIKWPSFQKRKSAVSECLEYGEGKTRLFPRACARTCNICHWMLNNAWRKKLLFCERKTMKGRRLKYENGTK
jgi:hypothetical protein